HNTHLELTNNNQANNNIEDKMREISQIVRADILEMLTNANHLNEYLQSDVKPGIKSNIEGIIHTEEFEETMHKVDDLLNKWRTRLHDVVEGELRYREENLNNSLFILNS